MEHKLSTDILLAGGLFFALIFFGISASMLGGEIEYMEKQDEFYCEMVQIFIDSKGENGWPNYKGIDCE